ncbi:MAG: response regulator [Ferruginibacter sp.]|nr:response regulator [Ferruginibacter sp.]
MAKILVIDDNAEHREVLTILLSMHNHTIECTATGNEIDTIIVDFKPALILLDVFLTGEDGRDLCADIKKRHKHIPIILLSAAYQILQNFTGDCADAKIDKPFDINYLVNEINDTLKGQYKATAS